MSWKSRIHLVVAGNVPKGLSPRMTCGVTSHTPESLFETQALPGGVDALTALLPL